MSLEPDGLRDQPDGRGPIDTLATEILEGLRHRNCASPSCWSRRSADRLWHCWPPWIPPAPGLRRCIPQRCDICSTRCSASCITAHITRRSSRLTF